MIRLSGALNDARVKMRVNQWSQLNEPNK